MSATDIHLQISDLVFHPDRFFKRVSNGNANLIPPFLIVLAGALISDVIILLFFTGNSAEWNPSILNAGSLSQQFILPLAISALLAPFICWAAFSLILFCLSRILGGTGAFFLTVQNVGYGMLPWAVSAAIPLASYLHRYLTYTSGPVHGGYTGIWMVPAGLGLLPLVIILIWSGYLWVPALQHLHGFTRRKAMAIVWAPVLVSILLLLPCIAW